jgi:hypothetical protein
MIMRHDFVANVEMAIDALKNPALANGSVVECGTWKGGMSAALIELEAKIEIIIFSTPSKGFR